MIKTIIFDLGGVCFKIDWIKINKELMKKFNVPILIKSTENKKIQKYYEDALKGKRDIKDMFRELNKDNFDLDEIIEFYKEMYKKYKKHDEKIYKLIKKLRNKFVIIGLTDTNPIHYKAHKEQGTIKDFHKVFTSFKTGSVKRETTTFKKILKELSVKPEEVIFIDDNEKNIEVARSVGIEGIIYKGYKQLIKEFKELRLSVT